INSRAQKQVDVGEIYRAPTASTVAATSDSACLDVPGESCLRNPLREICTVGSVREETSRWCQGAPSWKRRTQPREPTAYRDSSTRRAVAKCRRESGYSLEFGPNARLRPLPACRPDRIFRGIRYSGNRC